MSNAKLNIINPFLITIASVENLKTQNLKETLNHILVVKYAREKEELIAHIYVLSYVIQGNVNPVKSKVLKQLATVEKL